MNDFTKEELKYMSTGVKCVYTFNAYKEEMKPLNNLINKLQSMIDNYCEHQFYMQGCGENAFGQCHKCGEVGRLQKK